MKNHNYKKLEDYRRAKERDKRMTKQELTEVKKDMPDHYRVSIFCGRDSRDPAGLHEVVSVKEHRAHNTIEFEIAGD